MDPIISEVISNAFNSIAGEMGAALIRSAYSTNIKERRDCSCAVFAPDGSLISLAEHIPIHLGSMQGLMMQIARNTKKSDLNPGDVIIANDPFRGGGSHLPDVSVIKPVYHQNSLVAFVSNIAHWSDVGGRSPGVGTAGDSTEILQEGIRIPPVHIITKGNLNNDILELLLINMRDRHERLGDFRAQMAALQLGESRLHELFDRYGQTTIAECIADLHSYSQRRLQTELHKVAEGTFCFKDQMDDDGVTDKPLDIRMSVTISHDPQPSILFDFKGTSKQAAGGINMVWQALQATVLYSVKALFATDIPINEGFQRPILIKAPEGSLVNAREPAAVGGRTDTCQRVVDMIFGALYKAIPERVIAASNGATTAIIFGGTKTLSGRDFVLVEAMGGGMGARKCKDGMDGAQVNITNTSNLPIEAMEMEYPLRVLRYGLVPDSGGPGKYRGGLAIRKDIKALKSIIFSAHSDRHRIAPWGLNGGLPGSRGRFLLNPDTPEEKVINSKVSDIILKKGNIISIRTAGGGGYGSPLDRDPILVENDFRQGKVTRKKARLYYGVVFTDKGKIDHKSTSALRKQLKS
jgi:N-methylhydantoinase B